MMYYSIQPRNWMFLKGYGVFFTQNSLELFKKWTWWKDI